MAEITYVVFGPVIGFYTKKEAEDYISKQKAATEIYEIKEYEVEKGEKIFVNSHQQLKEVLGISS